METKYKEPTFLQRQNAEGRTGQKVTTDLLCPYINKSCDYEPDDERCHHKGGNTIACKHFFDKVQPIRVRELKRRKEQGESDALADWIKESREKYKSSQ